MVSPLLANQDLTPMLGSYGLESQGEKYRNLGRSGKVRESHGKSGNFF